MADGCLTPHRAGDALQGGPGLVDPAAPEVAREVHEAVAATAARLLAG